MKKLILGMLLASTVSANTIEEASSLYLNRGADAQNAVKAADIYKNLADQASSELEKAALKIKEAEALYYAGTSVSGSTDYQESFLVRGYEAANFAVQRTSGLEKANALYWYSANLAKYGEPRAIEMATTRWPNELKPALLAGLSLDKTVHNYGFSRIIGKAMIKLPFSSSSDGFDHLEEAYESTLKKVNIGSKEIEISGQVNNVLFYMWGIMKQKKKGAKYCNVIKAASALYKGGDEAYAAYDSSMIPETKRELTAFFKGGSKDDKKVLKYFKKICK
ncbi:hypothetical protein [Bacteriovorax sp. DB6_IX]|uniref:hypothetical protein n=1 Tax=Bacteriovorax sp. DB6_IX TaxID=1353530 RepID=UPI00038A14E4|nr:hypothetical protein [Bacteriovorax sp. DB6_IX]EQC48744.1 hypothetical protein M901_0093 [Bacteriovorax sp. DB6_IX]